MLKEKLIAILTWYDNNMVPGNMADILEPQITHKEAHPETIYNQQKMARITAQILMIR